MEEMFEVTMTCEETTDSGKVFTTCRERFTGSYDECMIFSARYREKHCRRGTMRLKQVEVFSLGV